MKKFSTLLLTGLLSLGARATHISGGEIYWDCLGGNQYRITLIVYRDCAGINLDPSYDLPITSPCGSTTVHVSTPGGTEISQLCSQQLPNSTCNGGNLPGTQEYVYTGVVTLAPCDSWTISWTKNWRNNAIVNLQAPGSQLIYIEATMNNVVAPCDDSPHFTNLAIPFVCLGYPITYSYGAYDAEGDSLVYSLIGARTTNGAAIPYVVPFSPGQPIPGITLDPQTGQLNFTLNVAGDWVVVVQVDIYDANGNHIGTVMRDMQFIAYPCSNDPPDPTTGTIGNTTGNATQTGPHSLQVCENGDFCFDMVISDPNAPNNLTATTNIANNLPGATFTYTGTNPITCHVCWTAAQNSAGFYPFIVNVSDGACPIPAFQTYVYSITVVDGIFISVTSTDESCAGMNNGTASVSVLDGTGPYQYSWGTIGASGPSITAGAGTYPVSVTDANGCVSAPTAAVINTTPAPTANAGPDLVACYGQWPIALQASSTNASSNGWSHGGGTYGGIFPNTIYSPSANEIANGGADLILTATGSGGCPADADTVHISISNSFINAAVSAVDATCSNANNGSATFTPASGTLTYHWNTTPVQTTATATGLGAGNYSVTATDALGCSTTLSTTVAAPSALTISNIQATSETCAGSGNGTVTVTVTGGTAPYTYSWSNSANTASITAGAGTYTVQVTDANGCAPVTASATVTAAAQPNVANAGADHIVCMGAYPVALNGAVTNATGGVWSGGAGSYNGSGLNAGYTPSAAEIANGGVDLVLTTTGNTNCPADADTVHLVLANAFLNAAITSTNATCNGGANGSASFTPVANTLSYAWNDAAHQTSATATGLGSGTYTVTVTDALGCDTAMGVAIGQPAAITITNIQATPETCAGAGNGAVTVSVTGGTAPYTYNWSNGAHTASITAGAGTYSVQVTDANGCAPATASATITAAAQPNVASAGADQVVCMGAYPVSLNGSVTNATGGTWSGGQGSFTGTGLAAHYTPSAAEIAMGGADLILTTTGNTGCPADADTVHLTLSNSFLNASITATDALCNGGSTGTATFTPALPSLTYLWSPSGQTAATAINLAAGTHTVTVTDQLSCDTSMSVTISAPTALAITNVQVQQPLCSGSSNGSATALVQGGTPGYTYQWSANTGGQTTASATGLGAGNYLVTVTDAHGCTAQGTATITAPAPILLAAQVPDTVCVNAPVQLTAQASGGNGNLTITWAGIGTGTSLVYSFPASQDVLVSVTDGLGCQGPALTLPVHVLDLSLATLTTYGDTAVCTGGTAQVGALLANYSGAVSYSWPELGTLGAGPHTVPVPGTETLHVTATNVCGQTLQSSVQLVLEVPPQITLPALIAEGCAPLTVQFPTGLTTQNVTWLWNLGDGSTSTAPAPTHIYAAGEWTVSLVVTTPAGCSAAALNTGSVIAHAPPTASFTASTYSTDMSNPTVQFTDGSAGSINAYAWAFGDGDTSSTDDPSHTYTDIGTYTVQLTVTDVNGCTDNAVNSIEILPVYDVTIPNAFTPDPSGGNGGAYDPTDLSNNVFYPFVRFVKDFKMRIWNRWGELVFESDDIKKGWDGYYRGQLSQQDVYVYRVWIRFVDDREAERMGDLTLFR